MMRYDEFVNQVRSRAHLSSGGEAVSAIRATLMTLAERLTNSTPSRLASQLPQEIGEYLLEEEGGAGEKFDLQEFYECVAERENTRKVEAIEHSRAVMSVLSDAVPADEMDEVRSQLPKEFEPLFELAGVFRA